MSRRKLRDFNDTPLDDTLWIRSVLPLPQVHLDTGPRTEAHLNASWAKCSAILIHGTASPGLRAIAEAICRLMSLRQEVIKCRK